MAIGHVGKNRMSPENPNLQNCVHKCEHLEILDEVEGDAWNGTYVDLKAHCERCGDVITVKAEVVSID